MFFYLKKTKSVRFIFPPSDRSPHQKKREIFENMCRIIRGISEPRSELFIGTFFDFVSEKETSNSAVPFFFK